MQERNGYMSKKDFKIIGIIMIILGLVLLFMNIRVGGAFFGNKVGIWLLLIGVDFVAIMAKPKKIFYIIMGILVIGLVVSTILNMRLFLHSMSFFKWLMITVLLFGGIGFVIKSKE